MTSLQDKYSMKQLATLSLLLALAVIFSYVEFLIPLPIPFPGIKLGLANSMILILLVRCRFRTAALLSFLRVMITGFLFGNLSMILYSLVGAMGSIVVMWKVKEWNHFSLIGISILGAVAHNSGQLLLAMMILRTPSLFYYFPVLAIAGCLTGTVIGWMGKEILKRIPDFLFE